MNISTWLKTQEANQWKEQFEKEGYLVVKDLLTKNELKYYQTVYDKLLSGGIDASFHRHDLGSHTERKVGDKENICQIMWPSNYVEGLLEKPLHQRACKIAQIILGDDIAMDFDMLISKSPHTDTETPFHQDQSYWLDMPDKRAVSVWVAMDDVTEDNGCMWFVPKSHLKENIRPHRTAKEGHHVMCCDGDESEFVSAPITAGSCTLHHGRTIHYTRGNSTSKQRRAFIVNYRPAAMVEWERNNNFDHGKAKMEFIQKKQNSQ